MNKQAVPLKDLWQGCQSISCKDKLTKYRGKRLVATRLQGREAVCVGG